MYILSISNDVTDARRRGGPDDFLAPPKKELKNTIEDEEPLTPRHF
jgi:hypothetical protein